MEEAKSDQARQDKQPWRERAPNSSPNGSSLPMNESKDETNPDLNLPRGPFDSLPMTDASLIKTSPAGQVNTISEEQKTTKEASSSDATIPDLLGSSPGYNLSTPYHVRNLSDGMEDTKRFSAH